MTETKSTAPVRVIEETSAYWRVLFDYPPFNIVDATIFEGLQELLARMDASPSLLSWWSKTPFPDFTFLTFVLTGRSGTLPRALGPPALPTRWVTLSLF